MNWIKDALLDVLSLVLIVLLIFTENFALEVALWVYTSLLLLSKILYFFVGFLQQKAGKTSVPDWFYHFIYLGAILLLLYGHYYYLGLSWGIIWLLSLGPLLSKKNNPSKSH